MSFPGCTPLSAFQGTLTNGRMEYSPTVSTRIPVGTIVNVVCYNGYTLSGNSLASCTASGWSPSTIGSCVQQVHRALVCIQVYVVLVLVVIVECHFSLSQGTTVTLQCATNYSVTVGGYTSATCYNGVWSPTGLASCQKTQKEPISTSCPFGIAPVLGATMTYSNDNPVGPYPPFTIVTATCQSGYVPNGIMTSTCSNGIWAPASLGTCELMGNEIGGTSCGRLGDPLSGTLVYSAIGLGPYPSGTSATVLCNIGSTLSGSPSAICTNGVWNPLPGTCVQTFLRKSPVKSNNITLPVADSPKEINSNVTIEEIPKIVLSGETCPPPMAPAFGEVRSNFTVI
uniref:Sushi domain-containing protein n=1 Tax=Caenorhabditis japonica TaxID=281687 RepID=A0A8R1E759_CAEJA